MCYLFFRFRAANEVYKAFYHFISNQTKIMARTKIRSPTLGDCRLYDAATGQDLILDGSSAQVLIADIHASVNLSQRFTNTSYTTISSAVYTFGLMAGAAVCAFEMIRQDGTRVEGVVKEKEAAKKEYEQAIQAGKTASLGQQETEDGECLVFLQR